MTEEEAKTKTCHRTLGLVPSESRGAVRAPSACIGSACMAWRDDATSMHAQKGTQFRADKLREGWVEAGDDRIRQPMQGRCGLAGP